MDENERNTNVTYDERIMAAWELELPKLEGKPKELYKTTPKLLPPAKYVLAVSGAGVARNLRIDRFDGYHPVIEVYELGEDGSLLMPKRIGMFRHVEILGPPWIYHDPQNYLHDRKRSSVLRTDSPLRVYEDTEEQEGLLEWGC